MAKIPADLPERMIGYRAKHNLTQKNLASKARLTPQTIGDVENKKRKTATNLTLVKIEEAIKEEML